MENIYTSIIRQQQHYNSVKSSLQKLLDEEKYSYKALKAYIILDTTFETTKDRRRLKWAKKYLRTHNIKLEEIRSYVEKEWKKQSDAFNELYNAVMKAHPSIRVVVDSTYMY